jgi:hypothetical protein
MDSIALTVAQACSGASAYTLASGYAVFLEPSGASRRSLFPPCRIERETRNDRGRVTHMTGSYPDRSRIVFSWHPARGARLDVKNRKKAS